MEKALGGTMKTKWMTLPEAVDYSRMGYSTLRKKIKLGLLPSHKPGKKVLIDSRELDIFIRKSRKKAS